MNTLNKVKEVADKSHVADDDDGADDYDFWQNLDVTKLKRCELVTSHHIELVRLQ